MSKPASGNAKAALITFLGSSLFRSAGIYTVANMINKALPFFMIPVLTRYLAPEAYGTYVMFTTLAGLLGSFTGLNIAGAIQRKFYELDRQDLPVFIANCLLILTVSTAAVSVVLLAFAGQLSVVMSVPEKWIMAAVTVSATQFVITIVLILWQGQLKPLLYGSFQILQTAFTVGSTLLLVVVLGYDWQGSAVSQVVSSILFALISFIIIWRNGWIRFSFNPDYIRQALKFGVPLIPHTFSSFLMSMTDRLFITSMVGIADTGIYSVGNQVGMIIAILTLSFNTAYVPWLFSKLRLNDAVIKRKIVIFTYGYYVIITVAAIALALIAPLVMYFYVGDKFEGAAPYIIWCALGYAFNGMYLMVTNYVFYAEKTHILSTVTLSTLVLNLLLNYLLIKFNGTVGAAQAMMFTFLAKFLLTWRLSSHVVRMPWNMRYQ